MGARRSAMLLANQFINFKSSHLSLPSSLKPQQFLAMGTTVLSRGVKTTSTIHPEPVHQDDEKVLEKVLKERENSEDLPESMMANPYERPRKICILCKHGIEPNYKNVRLLYQFVSPYTGKVYGRHITGLCKDKQEKMEVQAIVASNLGLMSNYLKEPEFLKDPKLCDPDRPLRPHNY